MIGQAESFGRLDSVSGPSRRSLDFTLLLSAAFLVGVGLVAQFSVDRALRGGFFVKQLLFAAVGAAVLVLFAKLPSAFWMRAHRWLYLASLGALAAVLVVGDRTKGATRWIDIGPLQFQPSEVSKVLLVLTLAAFFARNWADVKSPRVYLLSLAHVLPLCGLLLLQPHYAGALSLLAVWAGMAVVSGVSWRALGLTALALGFVGAAAWSVPGLLKDYHRERILAKVQPTTGDRRDADWQQDRAKIAFGTGGLLGVGFLKGEQKAARYIPEQQNDFVFTIIGEEFGLVGAAIVIAAFGVFFFRVWATGFQAGDPFGRLVAAGVFAVLGFHTVVNLGMNLGLIPVAGLWLPFLSYGGTALWMCMACLGLLLAVR
jgi:rod shape determining protein RodA